MIGSLIHSVRTEWLVVFLSRLSFIALPDSVLSEKENVCPYITWNNIQFQFYMSYTREFRISHYLNLCWEFWESCWCLFSTENTKVSFLEAFRSLCIVTDKFNLMGICIYNFCLLSFLPFNIVRMKKLCVLNWNKWKPNLVWVKAVYYLTYIYEYIYIFFSWGERLCAYLF